MTSHLLEIFDTMFSMTAVALGKAVPREEPERVSGSMGFGGESITGAVYLHLPAKFAASLAGGMIGTAPESLSEAEVNDVVGELTNMLTGGLKSWLCDASFPCAVSTPAVIRGKSFAIEAPPEIDRLCLGFSAGENHFSVELHYKFK